MTRVIDLDLKSYFDTIDHDLLMKLVRRFPPAGIERGLTWSLRNLLATKP
jgi:hypothetical protein